MPGVPICTRMYAVSTTHKTHSSASNTDIEPHADSLGGVFVSVAQLTGSGQESTLLAELGWKKQCSNSNERVLSTPFSL